MSLTNSTIREKIAKLIDEELGAGNTPTWLIDAILTILIESLPEKRSDQDELGTNYYIKGQNDMIDQIKAEWGK